MIPKELQRMQPMKPGERLGQNRDSEYLGAEDIDPGTEPVLTISALYNGMVTLQRGKENKDVVAFAEDRVPGIRNVRPLIVNTTNRKTLRKLYGGVGVEHLVGKKIQLYIDHNVRDPSTGDIVDGIRIRPRKPSVKKLICADCGAEIAGYGKMSADSIAKATQDKFGATLCVACSKKRAAAEASQTEETAPAAEG